MSIPKLVMLVPCTQVIQDKNTNALTLVNVVNGFRASALMVAGEAPVSVLPVLIWMVATTWYLENLENHESFEQRLELVGPDETRRELSRIPFTFSSSETHRVVATLHGFPSTVPGLHQISLSIRGLEQDDEPWTQVAEYPIALQIDEETPDGEEAS